MNKGTYDGLTMITRTGSDKPKGAWLAERRVSAKDTHFTPTEKNMNAMK